jgi:hypothetical protein
MSVLQKIQIDPTDCKSVFAEIQIDPTAFRKERVRADREQFEIPDQSYR